MRYRCTCIVPIEFARVTISGTHECVVRGIIGIPTVAIVITVINVVISSSVQFRRHHPAPFI